ncbi:unnamed protein product [Fusarium graminearum]|uniref:UBC core domain-containing protein n=1 Tax=Gibberella zeae TaxID=5518 RepID=A0A9N8NG40_GIBZA|nr:unnamed protein product [Fusarium graminearum]
MGIRQFNADLRAAIDSHFPCVSNLRKGDSDGEITFTYTPENEAAPIAIQALSTEPEAYPRHPGFLVFTSSEDGPVELEEWLQEISASTKDKTITDFINLTSKRLATKLESSESSDGDSAFDDNEEESSYDVVFDDELGINSSPSRGPYQATYTSTNRLRRHLREAKREGLHVWIPTEGRRHDSGVHGGKAPGVFHIFSLSIRASKLNVPEEALGAWGLKPSEYVVMLCRLPSGYPPLSTFLQSSQTASVQFKFGKCTNPNPSYSSAIRVFDGDDSKTSEGARKDESESPFLSMYMSLSLDALLNTDFPRLLRLRRSEGISWDQAQELWFRLGRGDRDPESVLQSTSQGQHESSDRFELEFLQQNFLGAEDINIILIAMQFGLQRLINCTKYCLVCSQRIAGGFEAIKPFVCEDSLCLFQYLSLGFCQSIEYEIINNPNVVDLLISFFYAAVATNFTVPNSSLREFPKGLGLKVATSGYNIPSDTEPTITAEVCFESNTIRFNPLDYAHYTSITEGRCITLVLKQSLVPQQPIMRGRYAKYVCIVQSCQPAEVTFRVISTYTATAARVTPTNPVDSANHSTKAWESVFIYKHEQDIDGLEIQERNQALTVISECIPPVHEMRQYLVERPGCKLSSWKRMDASTLGLLNWIVASNRSFIVQDASIPGLSQPEEETHKVNNLINGVEPGWVQFRFVQGSPEKEEVFLRELTGTPNSKKPWPTLFAWHGSFLGNWHSIIRTGLNFSVITNGRAYGNGVYLAKDFQTSRSYSSRGGGSSWPNSALRITEAISICEIVNDTARFVSTDPHFVVDQIDWIQCRYLFIKVDIENSQASSHDKNGSASYIEQDPSHQLTSNSKRIGIPQSAIPISRRRVLGPRQILGSSNDFPIILDETGGEPDFESNDELDDLLASDDEGESKDETAAVTRKRRRSSIDSGLGDARQPDNTTPFQPGQLDLGSLPKLVEPTWAASSPAALRALNGQIKDLQQVQSSTNIAMLGWYIDFEKLDNLFHWIVELHSFDMNLALAQDMIRYGCSSIVLEVRFGASFPISPPFVRVIRPRFVPFAQGGGGHVTMGGSICSELLTNSGWSPALSLEKVFLEVRMNLCEKDPPARIEQSAGVRRAQNGSHMDYGMFEAVDAYRRAATAHGWQIPSDLDMLKSM